MFVDLREPLHHWLVFLYFFQAVGGGALSLFVDRQAFSFELKRRLVSHFEKLAFGRLQHLLHLSCLLSVHLHLTLGRLLRDVR